MDSTIFRCLACGTDGLVRQPDAFLCPACHTAWPIRSGVPLFLKGLQIGVRELSLTEQQWGEVCGSTFLADTPDMHARLREIFCRTYHLPELHLSAENNYYFQRLPQLVSILPETKPDLDHLSVNEKVQYSVERHYVPETLPNEAVLTCNVRFVNEGRSIISSKGSQPVRVGFSWRTSEGALASSVGFHTLLPIDLAPGRAITLPVRLATPKTPGMYLLEIGFQVEGRWVGSSPLRLAMNVVRGLSWLSPDHWRHLDKPLATYDYEEDHKLSAEFLAEEIKDVPDPRILEVGGCNMPTVRQFPGELYVTDIDAQTLQVGELLWRPMVPHMHFVATDAMRLPFADGVFDCVALFATLHHLSDPVGCLREFRRVVKPTGCVMVGSEPVGQYFAEAIDPKLLKELESGINEQVFTEHELARMFLQAGLFATRVEIDRNAFRAILRPNASGQVTATTSRQSAFDGAQVGYKELLRLNLQWARRQFRRITSLLPGGRKAG